MRETSIKAYQEMADSGLLGKRQLEAYKIILEHGPMTASEVSKHMGIPGQWKRCSDLKKMGVVHEVGTRQCSVTGRTANILAVSGQMPGEIQIYKKRTEYEKGFRDGYEAAREHFLKNKGDE